MKLYFTCPATGDVFGSTTYALEKGYSVVASDKEKRELQGVVVLTKPCPFCGEKHRFDVSDVMCPFTGDTNEK